jgi:hypothetical protein
VGINGGLDKKQRKNDKRKFFEVSGVEINNGGLGKKQRKNDGTNKEGGWKWKRRYVTVCVGRFF